MHCSDNENVCSVKKENNLGFYRLHTIWKNDGFFVNITSKDGAWRGEMTPSDVSKMSALLQMEPESYLSQCKEALTCHDGQPGMVYAIENGSFVWKKVVDEDSGMKMRMGSVMVEPANFVDTIQNFVHAALNCNKKLQQQLHEITQDRNKILENKNELLNKLNDLVEVKNTLENDLYARFILLLNSKKKKIQVLENALEECKESNESNEIYRKSKNLNDQYEVDTENDASDIDEKDLNINITGKRKDYKSYQKNIRKCYRLPEESVEEKKIKSIDQSSDDNENVSYHLNYSSKNSPKPSTSEEIPKSTEKEIPLTKDELLDFFYGNS